MLKNLPDFLEHYSSKGGGHKALSPSSKEAGSPKTIVITSAGLRAADIVRYLILSIETTTFVSSGFTDTLKGFARISDKGACGG